MFSMHDISVCPWMNSTQFPNIKLWDVKFMMYIVHKVHNCIIGASYKCNLWLCIPWL
jgi:hypothetical protein